MAHRDPAGQERGARWGARRLGVARRQQQTFSSQTVDVRRRCTDCDAASVAAEVTPADVIREEHEHVRRAPVATGQDLLSRRDVSIVDELWLPVRRNRRRGAGDGIEGHRGSQSSPPGTVKRLAPGERWCETVGMPDTHFVACEQLTPESFAPFGQVLHSAPHEAAIALRDGEEWVLNVLSYDHQPLVCDHLDAITAPRRRCCPLLASRRCWWSHRQG